MSRTVQSQNLLNNLGRSGCLPSLAGPTSYTSKTAHLVLRAGYGIKLVWMGTNGPSGTTQETPWTNTQTVKAAVQRADGTIYLVYFSGSRTGTINPGQTLESDLVGIQLNLGETIFLRIYSASAGAAFFTNRTSNILGGEWAVAGVDNADSGEYGASSGYCMLPLVVTGTTNDQADNGVVVLGDSIASGGNDFGYLSGFLSRAIGTIHPVINMAVAGELCQSWLTNQRLRRLGLIARANAEYAILSWTNDAYAARTLAQFQVDLIAAVSELRAMGLNVCVCTLTPRTTSTDGWRTLANQTLQANNATRVSYNNWLRTQQGNGIFAVLDIAASVEDLATGKWKEPAGGALLTGTITATVAGTVTDNTKNFNLFNWVGYTVRNTTLNTSEVVSTIPTATTLNVSTATVYTIGQGYEISQVLTVDGTHPTNQGHAIMAASIDLNIFR